MLTPSSSTLRRDRTNNLRQFGYDQKPAMIGDLGGVETTAELGSLLNAMPGGGQKNNRRPPERAAFWFHQRSCAFMSSILLSSPAFDMLTLLNRYEDSLFIRVAERTASR